MAKCKATDCHTVKEAVEWMVENVDDLDSLRGMEERKLSILHHGFGTWVRNIFGLWGGNPKLVEATGEKHPDLASGALIHALWEHVNESG